MGSKKSIGPRDFADFSSPKLAYAIQHQAWLNSGWERFIISANIDVPYLIVMMLWCLKSLHEVGCLWLLLHWPLKSLWCTCYYFYRWTSYTCASISLTMQEPFNSQCDVCMCAFYSQYSVLMSLIPHVLYKYLYFSMWVIQVPFILSVLCVYAINF